MIVTKEGKEEGVGRMNKLGLLAIVMFLVVLVPFAAAIEMVDVNGKMINYTRVLIASDAAWENRTNEQDNITFNAEGLEWILVPYHRKSENEPIFSVELKTQLIDDEENAAASGVQNAKSGVDPKSIIDTRPDEEKFAGEEYKNALPAPRPAGFEYGGSGEDADKGGDLATTQGKQETGKTLNSAQQPAEGQSKAPKGGTDESLQAGSKSANAASSETKSSIATDAKEPSKDKSGEKNESFFAKVLKWLFGK